VVESVAPATTLTALSCAETPSRSVGLADHRSLVGDLIARVFGLAQHLARRYVREAVLLEVTPRVGLIDAVKAAGVRAAAAGLGRMVDQQQDAAGFTTRSISFSTRLTSYFGQLSFGSSSTQ